MIERKDQTGTIHSFDYDKLGRRTQDRITTLGSGVDGAARRIATTYDVRGSVESISTVDNATVGSGTVLSEVLREYNDLGMLTKEYQEHGGAKGASTPYVQYNYDETAVSGELTKGMRLKSIRYPNARLVHFTYGASGSDADHLNRLDAIQADSGGSPGTTLASYTYLGAQAVVEIDYEEPDVRLDLIGSGNAYSGFDRFLRIVDQKWYDYDASPADVDRYKYGYDRASSRIWRENTTTTSKDEFYTYDGMHRLKNFDRGDLNGTFTGISGTPVREYDWNLDPTGNWETLLKKTSGVTDFNQDRDHNKVNELTSLDELGASSSGGAGDWVDPLYDKSGNMTTMPQPASPASSYTAKYDAWNRMVQVKAGANTIADYEYDGLYRRISKTVSGTVRHFYYSMKWQVLEERVGAASTAESQHVFGPRYVDELILRDRDTDSNGSLDERLYYLQDANFNVTTLVNSSGDAQERYIYEPYGEVDVFTGVWGSRGPSSYVNRFMFTGREYDSETGLLQFRMRYEHAQVGTWTSREFRAYSDGPSLYQYGRGRPIIGLDPVGDATLFLRPTPIVRPLPVRPQPVPTPPPGTMPNPPVGVLPDPNAKPEPKPTGPNPDHFPEPNPTRTKPWECPKTKSDCTEDKLASLTHKVNTLCNHPDNPNSYQAPSNIYSFWWTCDALKDLKDKWEKCCEARRRRENQCFRGGDRDHQVEIATCEYQVSYAWYLLRYWGCTNAPPYSLGGQPVNVL